MANEKQIAKPITAKTQWIVFIIAFIILYFRFLKHTYLKIYELENDYKIYMYNYGWI